MQAHTQAVTTVVQVQYKMRIEVAFCGTELSQRRHALNARKFKSSSEARPARQPRQTRIAPRVVLHKWPSAPEFSCKADKVAPVIHILCHPQTKADVLDTVLCITSHRHSSHSRQIRIESAKGRQGFQPARFFGWMCKCVWVASARSRCYGKIHRPKRLQGMNEAEKKEVDRSHQDV